MVGLCITIDFTCDLTDNIDAGNENESSGIYGIPPKLTKVKSEND